MCVAAHVTLITTKTKTGKIDTTKLTTAFAPTTAKHNMMPDKKLKELLLIAT